MQQIRFICGCSRGICIVIQTLLRYLELQHNVYTYFSECLKEIKQLECKVVFENFCENAKLLLENAFVN